MSVDGQDLDDGLRTGGGWDEREGMPYADIEDAEQRELEVPEPEGEELGGEAGAEDWAL